MYYYTEKEMIYKTLGMILKNKYLRKGLQIKLIFFSKTESLVPMLNQNYILTKLLSLINIRSLFL